MCCCVHYLVNLNIAASVYHVVHVHHVDVDVDRVVIIGVHHVIVGVHCVVSPHHVVANVHRNQGACLVAACVHCVIVSVHQLCLGIITIVHHDVFPLSMIALPLPFHCPPHWNFLEIEGCWLLMALGKTFTL